VNLTFRRWLSELRIYVCNYLVGYIPSRRIRRLYYAIVMNFSVDPTSSILLQCCFDCKGGIEVGPSSVINEKCRLDSRGGLKIGKSVSISSDVVILTASHDPRSSTFEEIVKAVTIEDYVWIGTRAIILPGVTLGRGCVVGAGAVVTKSVLPGSTVVGIPARPIASGRDDMHYELSYRRLFH
jgi:acetyltransferase-like isoleucine patch superfamily enzyme